MDLTKEYIYEHLQYDLVIDNYAKFHGNIDYISQHFADGDKIEFSISDSQNPEIKPIIDAYHEAKQTEPSLTLENFLSRRAI